jgi:transposase
MSQPSPAPKKSPTRACVREDLSAGCETKRPLKGNESEEWMLRVIQKAESLCQIRETLGDRPGLDLLVEKATAGSFNDRTRALVVLAKLRRISNRTIARLLHISRSTVDRYSGIYLQHGVKSLFPSHSSSCCAEKDNQIPQEVQIAMLSTPRVFGIDQPTWRMIDLDLFFATRKIYLSRDMLRSIAKSMKEEQRQWLLRVVNNDEPLCEINRRLGEVPGLDLLLEKAMNGCGTYRKRALTILGRLGGLSGRTVARLVRISRGATHRLWEKYQRGGAISLFRSYRQPRPLKAENDQIKQAVFSVLHSPPADFGVNRTTWKMADLVECLAKKGTPVSRDVIRQVVKSAGYKWRKAKTVLTSNDPKYREKLQNIQSILSTLGDGDRFFSIDEFGPFAVKMRGGKRLVRPNEFPSVPQFQKSKGSLIVTAALELSRNQVTHFFSEKKNTEEIEKLLYLLLEQYKGCRTLYLSWDAASWHGSKLLEATVKTVNSRSYRRENGTPRVIFAPLPANAQFLNVIESVFSGMARAIIHNSNYASLDKAKLAIDRYLTDRNEHFRLHPRKAGNRIWGKERVPPYVSIPAQPVVGSRIARLSPLDT